MNIFQQFDEDYIDYLFSELIAYRKIRSKNIFNKQWEKWDEILIVLENQLNAEIAKYEHQYGTVKSSWSLSPDGKRSSSEKSQNPGATINIFAMPEQQAMGFTEEKSNGHSS